MENYLWLTNTAEQQHTYKNTITSHCTRITKKKQIINTVQALHTAQLKVAELMILIALGMKDFLNTFFFARGTLKRLPDFKSTN